MEAAKVYAHLAALVRKKYPKAPVRYFRAPGRTELGGNHTDHNRGRVLAAAIDLAITAAVVKTDDAIISLYSEDYAKPHIISLADLKKKKTDNHTTAGLVRGVAAYLREAGGKVGGFCAQLASRVPAGSGLSSSAAFELLIGTILNTLYNENKFSPLALARVGQRAENDYYGKPCGLMDQVACAQGGVVAIDFKKPDAPVVTSVSIDMKKEGQALFIVVTGGDHASLTAAYAAIPAEMKSVAAFFGKETLSELKCRDIEAALPRLRAKTGDRAIMRALHFFHENDRVRRQVLALHSGDFAHFLGLVNESADSSWELLQNCVHPANPARQGIGLALALSRNFLGREGACRVHGGGFAGTIQCWVPTRRAAAYKKLMDCVFGQGSVIPVNISPTGATETGLQAPGRSV